jgi:intracellular septation protein
MKQLIDYIPLLVFFLVWSLDERLVSIGGYERTVGGVFSATEFLLVASTLVYGALWLKEKRLDKLQWITFVAVVLFCIPTIVFRNIEFLKWKAPIVNWLFASIFLGSRFIGEKPAIEHMMGHAVPAPREVWQRLNLYWVLYFFVLGAINLAVALLLSEALWVKFKVFGNLALTFGFVFAQMPLLSKYLEEPEGDTLK